MVFRNNLEMLDNGLKEINNVYQLYSLKTTLIT